MEKDSGGVEKVEGMKNKRREKGYGRNGVQNMGWVYQTGRVYGKRRRGRRGNMKKEQHS